MTDRWKKEFIFNEHCEEKFRIKCIVEVWCDGREHDPTFESYRPVYSYSILNHTEDWEYNGNDIYGGCNSAPDIRSGAQSLLGFLAAAQEGLPEDTEGESENAELFPQHVREWAYLMKDELFLAYEELNKEMEEKK